MDNILWNDSSLLPPPVNTYKNTEKNIDHRKMQAIFEDVINVVENQQIFHNEAAIVTRLIYKLGRKFRHDIGYSFLNRTNTALLKYNSLNFIGSVKTFLSVTSSCESYLPTRQMLEYVLVRMQTFSKLMTRIVLCSRKGATYYFDRIKRGDALWLSFMPYIVLSRIWYLARHLLKNACRWYNLLISFRLKLKVIGVPFIPEGYCFPDDLSEWLDLDWLDEDAGQMWQSSVISSFLEINSDVNYDKLMGSEIVEKILKESNDNDVYLSYSKTNVSNDLGETISRENYNGHINKTGIELSVNSSDNIIIEEKKKEKQCKEVKTDKNKIHSNQKGVNKNNNHNLNNVVNKKILKAFLKTEENYRINNEQLSLSANIGFIQWQSLKNVLSKCDDCEEKKFNKIFKRIWKKKCNKDE